MVIVVESARIGGVFHPLVELRFELVLGGGECGLAGEVVKLMRVFANIVEFFRRTFGETQLEEWLDSGFVAVVKDEGFGWAIVTIAEGTIGIFVGLRVAGRPTVRTKIVNVKKVAGADGADGIAQIAGANVGVALAFEENDVSGAAFFLAGQQTKEAVAGHLRQRFQAGGFQESRREVHEVDEIVADLACFDLGGPAHGQGLARSTIIQVGFAAWKGPAIIAGYNDDGVVHFTGLFEQLEHGGYFAVKTFDFPIIVEDNVAGEVVIRPERWHNDILSLQTDGCSGAGLVGAMGIGAAEPKTKRFSLGNGFEEIGEILEVGAGRISGEAAGAKVSGAPAFSGAADGVSGFFEQVGIDREFFGQEAPETTAFFEPMRILAGEHGGSGRCAGGGGAKTIIEENALAGHAIKSGGTHDFIAINARVRPTPIIGQAIEDVGTGIGCGRGKETGQ